MFGFPSIYLLIISISIPLVVAYPSPFLNLFPFQNISIPLPTIPRPRFPTLIPYTLPNLSTQSPNSVLSSLISTSPSFIFPIKQQLKKRFYTPPSNPNLVVDYQGYWFVNCTIGSQILNPILDTGSSDIWFLSPSLPKNQTTNLKTYTPHLSTATNSTFSISYGQGNNLINGSVYLDTLSFGSETTQSITSVPIGSATEYSNFFTGELGSGIIGLAFQSGSSVIPKLVATDGVFGSVDGGQGLLNGVMIMNVGMDGTGEFGFGGEGDKEKYLGELVGVGVVGDSVDSTGNGFSGSWTVENVTYVVNDQDIGVFDIVFDTGGPQTTAPNETVYTYYSQIAGAVDVNGNGKGWDVPCSTLMPDLTLRFDEQGSVELVIPGSSFLQIDNGDGTCQSWFVVEDSLVRGLTGNAFFMSHYVVFDHVGATVSWARQV